jgi:hypothetical protein
VADVGVPVLLLGALTFLGTLATGLVAPLTPRSSVPVCCRRRVDAFAARTRITLLAALLSVGAGTVLLLV